MRCARRCTRIAASPWTLSSPKGCTSTTRTAGITSGTSTRRQGRRAPFECGATCSTSTRLGRRKMVGASASSTMAGPSRRRRVGRPRTSTWSREEAHWWSFAATPYRTKCWRRARSGWRSWGGSANRSRAARRAALSSQGCPPRWPWEVPLNLDRRSLAARPSDSEGQRHIQTANMRIARFFPVRPSASRWSITMPCERMHLIFRCCFACCSRWDDQTSLQGRPHPSRITLELSRK
mmetsp:Transcript_18330/g.45910  ORF Transcript_18330/g.45910 Transcript_18330/m.45910 type:complete len:236 (+) Transcript_18330:364-1071(+)